MIEEMQKHLTTKLIPFWNGMKDERYGGFYGWMDYELKLHKKAEKGCILNSRILWFYANAYLLLQDETLLVYAKHAYEFLITRCLDSKNGGVYWSLSYDGTILDRTKHTYNQAFAIYALSSYYEATKEERALKEARGLFQLIETRCRDSIGYLEAFDEGFTPVENDKLSENGVIAEKTMNTLLHVFEAYTQLYRITGDLAVRSSLCRILDSFATQIYNPLLRRQEVFFDRNLHSLLDLHSYGHDIETAWLIDWGVEVLGEESYRNKMEPITRALAKEVYQRAYQKHSLSNECENGVVDTSRVWWVQAEAVVGFYNAYEKTGEIKYQEAAREIWGFIKEYIIDGREGSEWYWKVDENGIPNREKPMVEPWKCPYHNGRMCFEIIRRSNNAASKVL